MAWKWKRMERPDGRTCYIAVNICVKCGIEFTADNPSSTKYCPDCRKQIRAEQNRARVRKHREKKKERIQ